MPAYKRQRIAGGETSLITVSREDNDEGSSIMVNRRIELKGHQGPVLCSKFSSGSGEMIASGSTDKHIYLWNTPSKQNLEELQRKLEAQKDHYDDKEAEVPVNFAVLKGHKSAITSLRWNNEASKLISGSADQTCGYWDVMRVQRVRKFKSKKHANRATVAAPVINDVDFLNYYDGANDDDNNVFASCGDDGCLRLWDVRSSSEVAQVDGEYPLMTVHCPNKMLLKNGMSSGVTIFTAGVEAVIYGYDHRMMKEPRLRIETLHSDSITGLSSSQSIMRDTLVSSSMDGTVRLYDYGKKQQMDGVSILPTYFSKSGSNESEYLSRCVLRSIDEFNEVMVSGTSDGLLGIWSLDRELGYLRYDERSAVIDCDVHPLHSNVMMSSSANGSVYVEEVV